MKEDLNRHIPQKINEFASLALAGRYPLVLFCRTQDCFFFVIMWELSTLLSDANQHKDLIQESLVAENSYALLFPK